MNTAFKRVVIKISGEALAGEKKTGFDFELISEVCAVLKRAADQGTQIGIVIGGGNFWRGVKDGAGKVERVSADRMGMLATCMNCLAVCDVLRQLGAKARVMTAVDIMGVGERYDTRRAIEYLEASSPAAAARPSSPPIRRRPCGRRKSTRTRSCSPRTSTAYTLPIRERIPRR